MKNLKQTIDESILLEENLSTLYMVYASFFEEDSAFWKKLSEEEVRHAEIIAKAGKIEIHPDGVISAMLYTMLQDISEDNNNINTMIDKYQHHPPSREDAFNTALSFEKSATEIHFQKFMAKHSENILFQLFQKLNAEDKDHLVRIRDYMNENGIHISRNSDS
jgi:ferritin